MNSSNLQPGDMVRHEGLPGRWRIEGLAARLPGRNLYRLWSLDEDRELLACELELVRMPRPQYLNNWRPTPAGRRSKAVAV